MQQRTGTGPDSAPPGSERPDRHALKQPASTRASAHELGAGPRCQHELHDFDHRKGVSQCLPLELVELLDVDIAARSAPVETFERPDSHENFVGHGGLVGEACEVLVHLGDSLPAVSGAAVDVDAEVIDQHASGVGQRRHRPGLDVEGVLVLAASFDDHVAEEAERRRILRRVSRHERKKRTLGLELLEDVALQLGGQGFIAVHGPEVEEDVGVHHRDVLRLADPLREVALPFRKRLIPLGVARHHVAWAALESRVDQHVDDTLAELLEELHDRLALLAGVSIENRVVLVGSQELLLATFASECEPAERDRGLHAFFGELVERKPDRPTDQGVVDLGDHAGEEAHPDFFFEILPEELLGLVAKDPEPFFGLCTPDFGENDRRVAALRLEDVVLGDDARHRCAGSAILGDCEVMKILLHDRRDERREGRLVIDGEDGEAHDLGNRLRHVPALCDHLGTQVGVGDDAERETLFVDDQNRADAAVTHHRRGLPDARIGCAGEDVTNGIDAACVVAAAGLLVAARGTDGLETIDCTALGQIGREVGRKEHRHARVSLEKLVEVRLGEHVQERVVFGFGACRVRPTRKKRSHAEDVPTIADVDEDALAVDHLSNGNLSFDDDVEFVFRLLTFVEDDFVRLQVPNANAARDAVEEAGLKAVEWRMFGEAVGHGQNHRIGRHAHYPSRARWTISETSLEIPGADAMRSSSAFIDSLLSGSYRLH